MGSEPITDTSPLLERTDGTITTTLEYHTCETLGLVKMDFLGLANLTVIRDTLHNIERNGKKPIDYTKIPLDDKETYQMLSRGDTLGVFQLDSDGMRSLLRQLRPDNFNDISALIALYRPGPMDMDSHINYAKRKNGLQEMTPIHPEVAEPLAPSSTRPTASSSTRSRCSPPRASWPATRSAGPTCCVEPWARRSPRCWPRSRSRSSRA